MDLNAATAGWFGWQWHDKVKRHFRSDRIIAAKHRGEELSVLVSSTNDAVV